MYPQFFPGTKHLDYAISVEEYMKQKPICLSCFFLCLTHSQFFPGTKHLDYAISVEEYTLQKAANLVLNVDGCIGALFLDLLHSSGCFSQREMDDIISVGYLNGLFVLARSIGLIGHALDQKRLQQPLYRHPWEDVLCEWRGGAAGLPADGVVVVVLSRCVWCGRAEGRV